MFRSFTRRRFLELSLVGTAAAINAYLTFFRGEKYETQEKPKEKNHFLDDAKRFQDWYFSGKGHRAKERGDLSEILERMPAMEDFTGLLGSEYDPFVDRSEDLLRKFKRISLLKDGYGVKTYESNISFIDPYTYLSAYHVLRTGSGVAAKNLSKDIALARGYIPSDQPVVVNPFSPLPESDVDGKIITVVGLDDNLDVPLGRKGSYISGVAVRMNEAMIESFYRHSEKKEEMMLEDLGRFFFKVKDKTMDDKTFGMSGSPVFNKGFVGIFTSGKPIYRNGHLHYINIFTGPDDIQNMIESADVFAKKWCADDLVKYFQYTLGKVFNISCGTPDRVYGPLTQRGVSNFQITFLPDKRKNIGVLDTETVYRMNEIMKDKGIDPSKHFFDWNTGRIS